MEHTIIKRVLSWPEIQTLVSRLSARLPRDFDALLIITRGGLVPGGLLSEELDIRNVLVAAVQFYSGIGQTLDQPIFFQFPADPILYGKRILVVDDIWDSGRTAMAVRERVRDAGGTPVLAVLQYKPRRSRYPDQPPEYYAEETDDWIVYPWETEE
ncbi:MAG: phosphoribosyltransferase [Anaerolineae bacterium]|nr:phosphoribosyltransferase [Anaerolineae bacterium]